MLDGVGHDLLPARGQRFGGPPASPARMGRVGVLQSRLRTAPVGQRQLRSEKGIVAPGCLEYYRYEQCRGARVTACRRVVQGRPGRSFDPVLSQVPGRAFDAQQAGQSDGEEDSVV